MRDRVVVPLAGGRHKPGKLDASRPLDLARRFRAGYRVADPGVDGFHHCQGTYYRWHETHYRELERDEVHAAAYAWLDRNGLAPTRRLVTDLLDAIRAASFLPAVSPPAWLPGYTGLPVEDLLAVENGLVNLQRRELLPADPRLFVTAALSLAFDPSAPPPLAWFKFLASIWSDDSASLDTLQEWFGLCALTGDTSHQKALLIVGPKRSGKGTILRVLRALAGADNVVAPTLASLAERFGLQSLIGKRVALVSDARLSGHKDIAGIAESLLRISGEDEITVERKHVVDWTGRLPTRFTICSNELPHLADASAALSSRFIVLRMQRSFLGQEDHGLTERLLGELPGILLWAMDGLDRLRARGRLLQPETGRDLAAAMEELASPVAMFACDCLVEEHDATVPKADVFELWRAWCDEHGHQHPGSEETLGKRLRAALPGLAESRPWDTSLDLLGMSATGRKVRCYRHVRLTDDARARLLALRHGGTHGR